MSQLGAVITAGVLLFTFGANEVTHGSVAETMGFGHHHLADYGGYHCAGHDDAAHAELHYEHMHGQAWNGSGNASYGPGYHDHAACYDGGHMHEEHMGPYDGHMGPGMHQGAS